MENLKQIMSNLEGCVLSQSSNIGNADAKEMMAACDMLKDVAMAKYYCAITKAMEESGAQYGVDYNENGKMYYTPHLAMPKEYRDDYRKYYGGMYEQGMNGRNGGMNSNSRYESARRHYTETKAMKGSNADGIDEWLDTVKDDMKELVHDMDANERAVAKRRITELANML